MTIPTLFRIARWTAGIAVLLLVLALIAGFAATRWQPSPQQYPLQGVDVSERQGAIDWFAVKAAGAQFAYVRATVGSDGRDPRFAEYWAGVDQAGLRRGAVLVFSLCRLATDQANAFITTVPRDANMLPAAVDLDFHDDCTARPDRDVVTEEVRRLLTAIETHTGKPALLRIGRAFDSQYQISSQIPRPLWAKQPFLAPNYFPRSWTMWQASRFRRIDGVENRINWDVVTP